jgi:hypothetical protein
METTSVSGTQNVPSPSSRKYRIALVVLFLINAPVLGWLVYTFDISLAWTLGYFAICGAFDLALWSLFAKRAKREARQL